MSKETTSAILRFVQDYHNFNIEDLFDNLRKNMDINKSSLQWHLYKLVKENILVRTGRGIYAKATISGSLKNSFLNILYSCQKSVFIMGISDSVIIFIIQNGYFHFSYH